ncbi:unnamed protein product, partial [Staurois parvus]
MYTDHQGTDDQCALMISVAPSVPLASAHQCHIYASYQCCQSAPLISASQCHMSAAFQCPSVMPINAHQ